MKSSLSKYSRLFHTLKYLKFKQIYYRALYKFKSAKVKSVEIFGNRSWSWHGPSLCEQSIFNETRVRFLNEDGEIVDRDDWNSDQYSKLWLYNLHYFDDLSSVGAEVREQLHYKFVNRWIKENPPCLGNGWEPYPISLRLVNWVKWFSKKTTVDEHYLASMELQAQALIQQLEYHILGNHLFANGKALVFVGAFLNSMSSDEYLKKGLKILDFEVNEQFLNDGGHFELSPMYHSILLWDLLELIGLAQISQNLALAHRLSKWNAIAKKALSWLQGMIHKDGEVSFFNDAAIGIAHCPSDIFKYAEQLGLCWHQPHTPLHVQNASGYTTVEYENYSFIFDHAQVGPDYLPGHAHADTLSFELSVGDERIFVNSGTSLYGISDERLRQRQTAAHNTVEVCGQSSSEVWSGFRVARRAKATLEEATACQDYVRLTASHDGYKRLRPKVNHKRSITANANGLKIEDTLTEKVSAVFHLHIHPDVTCARINSNVIQLKSKKGKKLTFKADSDIELLPSTYHPNFGVTIANNKIVIPFESGCLVTRIDVEG